MSKVEKIKERIVEILRHDNRGLTIQELSDQLDVTRITASVALANLEGAGTIAIRAIGNCKLHYLAESYSGENGKQKSKAR